MTQRDRVDVLWCSNRRQGPRGNGWAFPAGVRRKILEIAEASSVLHLFGGLASFGIRQDLDGSTRPHVIADAWLPPFAANSFDVVVLDPPYVHFNQQAKDSLFRAAAYIARDRVIWFHTVWMSGGASLQFRRGWLVRVGDSCQVRALQEFVPRPGAKTRPDPYFSRGPAMRYNRWLTGQNPLPL